MKTRTRVLFIFIMAVLSSGLVNPLVASAAEWQPNTFYAVGALVTYQGPSYNCIQAHTSQVGWEPPNAPALWQAQATPTATPTATVPTPSPSGSPTATATATSTATPTSATPTATPAGPTLTIANGTYNCLGKPSWPMKLTWTATASSYTVWFSRSSGGAYSAIANLTTTSYFVWDTTMTGYYKISTSPTAFSNVVNGLFIPPPCPMPTASPTPCPTPAPLGRPNPTTPTNLTGAAVQWYAARLTWTPPIGATDVHVLRATTSGGPYALVASVDAGMTSYLDYVASGKTYYYVVRAVFHYVAGSGSCQQIHDLGSGNSNETGVFVPNDF